MGTIPQVKGLQMLGMVKTLRAARDEALKALPPHLHHYLSDRIVVSAWYSEEDHMAIVLATGRVVATMVKAEPYRFIGEQGAKNDLSGIYASMLREGDPITTLQRTAQAWTLYHNTGENRITVLGPKSVRTELVDFPFLTPEVALVHAGYLCGIARAAGALGPECDILPSTAPDRGAWLLTWR